MLRRVYPLYLRLKKIFVKTSTIRAVMIGRSGSGKTTLGKVLEGKDEVRLRSVDPTYGLTITPITVTYDGRFDKEKRSKKRKASRQALMLWDFGGSKDQEKSWPSYFSGTDIFIFVIDSSREKYVEQASKLLDSMIPFFPPHIPILFLANKQDSQFAIPVKKVEAIMMLREKIQERVWRIFPINCYPKRAVNPSFKPGTFRSRFEERLRRGMGLKKMKTKSDVDSKMKESSSSSSSSKETKTSPQDKDESIKEGPLTTNNKTASELKTDNSQNHENVDTKKVKESKTENNNNEEKGSDDAKEDGEEENKVEDLDVVEDKLDEESSTKEDTEYIPEDEEEDATNKLPPLVAGKQHVTTSPNGVDDAMNWLVSAVREFRCDEELQMKLRFHEEMEAEAEREKKKREAQERKAQKKINDKKAHEKFGMRRFVGAGDHEDEKKDDEKKTDLKKDGDEGDVVEQTFEMEE